MDKTRAHQVRQEQTSIQTDIVSTPAFEIPEDKQTVGMGDSEKHSAFWPMLSLNDGSI